MIDAVLAALDALGQASGVASSAWRYAAVSGAHVAAIALLFGPIVLVGASFLGVLHGLDGRALAILRRTAALGAAGAIATGILLLSTKATEYAANPVVQIKLAVVALGVTHALTFEVLGGYATARRGTLRVVGAVSLGLWSAALMLGRLIAFSR